VGGCSIANTEATVGALAGRKRSSGHEPGGECGDASPATGRQL
jgi:hypothetical protein